MNRAVRRTLVAAVLTPVAGAVMAGQSAFAADQPAASQESVNRLDANDQKLVDNLNARAQDKNIGSTFSGVVMDAESNEVIWGHDAKTALMPASNTKLATATAALTLMGPDHKFTTKVVYGDGTLTLVGGGDRTLTTADLTELAKSATAGLKNAGLDTVKVRIDDSLFAEPTLAEGWNSSYYDDQIAPVRSLVVDGKLVQDTAVDAGKVFAEQLTEQGIDVTGDVTRGQAGSTDFPVAEHQSAELSTIVEQMLKTSDNDIAETLLRATALASGREATYEGGTAAVRDVLTGWYGISVSNFEIHDGSGLSRSNRITAQTVAEILDLTTDSRHSDLLKSITDGLPVAGEAGSTLGPEWGRFDTENSECAVGKVKGKTGTLTGAIALSGLTQGKDGRWKVFSFIENDSTADGGAIKDALDGLAATVNGCWA
ncbi:D-alanyl-D-alanine carboxypeptidase/D-alanyl-D-alanine-endopeptidase [Streptomyces sp. NBC_01012]|uniref:D-alanyl-D-alanine carboxypeptidase/D-alanyl-D-alanine endopeptidase n=1 Tax=Streptomyces sp. NBC_01012 TaxID=2903717 RepID=UPI00386AF4E3|nr:D-alanyl-D-alanine carboxypeptidase/D-alanyl-D-alanine-endopeptidase [Streptomyces sp. NBC_01012]